MKIPFLNLDKLTKNLALPWQHPIVNVAMRAVDPFDSLARALHHRHNLPKYSIRVRSYGMRKQFGAQSFELSARMHVGFLTEFAGLNADSRVLAIGCGCGRVAFQLAKILKDSNYSGIDIDRVAIRSCIANRVFKEKKFQFAHMDVQNGRYNPRGAIPPSKYEFPYPSASFDVIFLICVFTYMLPADVRNYVAEIGRMLAPNGTCMMSTFLMDWNECVSPRGG